MRVIIWAWSGLKPLRSSSSGMNSNIFLTDPKCLFVGARPTLLAEEEFYIFGFNYEHANNGGNSFMLCRLTDATYC